MLDRLLLFIGILLSEAQDCSVNKQRGILGSEQTYEFQSKENLEIDFPVTKELFQNITKDTSLVSYNSTLISELSWRVHIEIEESSRENPVLVFLKDGKTEKSFRLPYSRTKGRSKDAITVPFSARAMDLCPYETIGENSVLNVFLHSSSRQNIRAKIMVQLNAPWLDWKKVADKKYVSERRLSLSSPVVKKSFFSPFEVNNDESILITIESKAGSDCFCSIVSIQQPSCPYFDSVSSAIR